MSPTFPEPRPGLKVRHPELGEGVVLGREPSGFITVFFREYGERQVPAESFVATGDRFDRIVENLRQIAPETLERLWLAVEAEELPLMESAAALTTSAPLIFRMMSPVLMPAVRMGLGV